MTTRDKLLIGVRVTGATFSVLFAISLIVLIWIDEYRWLMVQIAATLLWLVIVLYFLDEILTDKNTTNGK